ncbi:hypothetical protein POM88_015884 [Heracleum sosnowskyi]|uniref:SHSP domain-containing protein n=1 Tax=Heracleum sosnowskyi TaxID=360622 RepID=A0AAD8MW99_9APIA|nr:hypothetical protein POM88_015884 [Heracleum sosnowskyi]
MAKKKRNHQDQTLRNCEKKVESLKSLNSVLLKQICELRQQIDSLIESCGLLESDLERVEVETSEMLEKATERGLEGEIERDLMFVFVGVQLSEIVEGFRRERRDSEEKLGGFEREIVRLVKEKSEVEEVKREFESERDELRKEIDGLVEENRGLKLRIGEVKELNGKLSTDDPLAILSQVKKLLDHIPTPVPEQAGGSVVRVLEWDSEELDDFLILSVDMPGLAKEHIEVCVEENSLIVKGEGGEEEPRSFSGAIDLPNDMFHMNRIKAVMKNGILKLFIPKIKKAAKAVMYFDVE